MKIGYLQLEAVNLGNFISDTKDLNTIRGGSLLLLNAMDEVPRKLKHLNFKLLATGASIGLYQFDVSEEQDARQILSQVAEWLHYHPRLRCGTFTISLQLAEKEESFDHDLKSLSAMSRWQQMQSPTVALTQSKTSEVCKLDLVRPATRTIAAPESGTHLVSESVAVRRLAGQKLKQHFYQRQIGRLIQRQFVHELKELTADKSKGNLNEKMAVIYLDGNGFGKIKNTASHSPEAYKNFDQTVKSYRREMLEGLLDRLEVNGDWQTDKGKYRIETLLWGGDELMWIVPAWKGWETLQYFYKKSESWKFNDDDLRHSGGMVFCHHNAPIHRITKLAKDLAELAKDKDRQQNLFAYEVLESFDHVGRKIGGYRTERSPQPVDPKQKDHVDSEVLILDGADMSAIKYFITSASEKLPRKQLHEITNELLWQPQKPIDLAKRARDRDAMLKRINGFVDKVGISKDDLDLDKLKGSCGGEEAFWLHVNALWDYLI